MPKSNDELSNLNVSKPPLKKTKTLPHQPFLNLRVSVDSNGDSAPPPSALASTTTRTVDFTDQQWNYPSFLGIGSTSRKRRSSTAKPPQQPLLDKTHTPLLTPPLSSSPPPLHIRTPQHYNPSSPLFYLVSYFFTFLTSLPLLLLFLFTLQPFSFSCCS